MVHVVDEVANAGRVRLPWDRSNSTIRRLGSGVERLTGIGLIGVFTTLRVQGLWPARQGIGNGHGDAIEYLRIAHLPLLGTRFFTEHKPWGYPLFLKLVMACDGFGVLGLIQLALSLVGWTALALAAASQMRSRPARLFVLAAVLGVSSSWPVAQWDSMPMSESLSLSLFALLVAGLIWFIRTRSSLVAAGCALIGLYFGAVRDANALLVCLLLLAVAVFAVRRGRRATALILIAAAIGSVAAMMVSSGVRRWEVLTADQIGKRVLLDPQMTRYFQAAGMPIRPHLSRIIHEDTRRLPPAQTLLNDPRFAFFKPWFMSHAQATFDRYELTHPSESLVKPIRAFPNVIGTNSLAANRDPAYRSGLPDWLERFVYPSNGNAITLWMTIALLLGALAAATRVLDRRAIVPFTVLASAFPLAIATWDAEPSEILRHEILSSVGVRLGLVLVFAYTLDRALAHHKSRTKITVPRLGNTPR